MLARLDAATIALTAVAVACALAVGRGRAAVLPVLAGICAVTSAVLITPAIHAMRVTGMTASGRFGLLHAVSTGLLVLEMILLAVAVCRAPQA